MRRYRRNRPEVMWHGTSSVLAPEILAHGFVPEPPRKRWGPEAGHMASYPGTYFSSNWMTAWAAAGNAVDRFGGNKVMFEAVVELLRGIPDEDHLPDEAHVLARSYGLEFLPTRSAHELLYETRPESLQEELNAATAAYISDLRQRFVSYYGRYPGADFSPAEKAGMYPAIFRLMKATLKTIAGLYRGGFSGKDYRRADETPEMRSARGEVAEALRGLIDRIPQDQWHGIHNLRLDRPTGFEGESRIVSATEVIYPSEVNEEGVRHWTSCSLGNPYIVIPLYGPLSQNFMNEFKQHVMGHLTDYRIAESGREMVANPPITMPPEATDRERTILSWIYEFWHARDDWGVSEHTSPIDAESAARRMRRAIRALEFLRLFRKRGPIPTPEAYMARLWKKYHPPEGP